MGLAQGPGLDFFQSSFLSKPVSFHAWGLSLLVTRSLRWKYGYHGNSIGITLIEENKGVTIGWAGSGIERGQDIGDVLS